MDFAVDPDEDLVEVPFIAGAGAPTAQLIGVGLPELGTPGPDRLIADHDTTRQHQLLDLTKAQREPSWAVKSLHFVSPPVLMTSEAEHPLNSSTAIATVAG